MPNHTVLVQLEHHVGRVHPGATRAFAPVILDRHHLAWLQAGDGGGLPCRRRCPPAVRDHRSLSVTSWLRLRLRLGRGLELQVSEGSLGGPSRGGSDRDLALGVGLARDHDVGSTAGGRRIDRTSAGYGLRGLRALHGLGRGLFAAEHVDLGRELHAFAVIVPTLPAAAGPSTPAGLRACSLLWDAHPPLTRWTLGHTRTFAGLCEELAEAAHRPSYQWR